MNEASVGEWAPEGPEHVELPARGRVAAPRLARHTVRLDDGHRVQIAVAGRGVPFVVVHGFSAEGLLYAQTLSRLVSAGFKVIAIDTAGHGGTAGFASGGGDMAGYGELLGRAVDHLGIKRALYAGHSMGGRLVSEGIGREPKRAIAVMLIDAIVGGAWDRKVALPRFVPPVIGAPARCSWPTRSPPCPWSATPVRRSSSAGSSCRWRCTTSCDRRG